MLSKSQHEGFAKFFEQPNRASLADLLAQGVGEADYLDFKEAWPALQKVAKHVLAMANSGGGALVVGVREDSAGRLKAVGLNEFLDKATISQTLRKYVPPAVDFIVLDLEYPRDAYPDLEGKKFQVLLTEYDPHIVPVLALRETDGIRSSVVYLRSGTESREATGTELERLINQRIETGYASTKVLELEDHVRQLKALYDQRAPTMSGARNLYHVHELTKTAGFYHFIDELIEAKEAHIRSLVRSDL